jgi:hypothetical protein
MSEYGIKGMKNPVFLLQKGDVMMTEKFACSVSDYPICYCSYEDLSDLDSKTSLTKYVPVGSVEFTQKYAERVGITLPPNLSYYGPILDFAKREIKKGLYKDAFPWQFVKPYKKIKSFTGGLKGDIESEGVVVGDDEMVWISQTVPFESEFRFYVQSYANRWEILGWSRYDDLDKINPDPDVEMVKRLAEQVYTEIGPNAYSIDIGWRPDLEQYDVVEMNDAWALGFYNNNDPQSKPPTKGQYANMLYSRWVQLVFCSLA